jgi:hypothetical protein
MATARHLEVVTGRPQNDCNAPVADLREGRTWVSAQYLAAVIYNPTKVSDKSRTLIEDSLQRDGWEDTL